jgi:quercetin dioxygenase-like cupin family protein
MSEKEESERQQVIDARPMSPPARHGNILKIFDSMQPGGTLLVVNDHEPVHLLHFMKHERRDFDSGAYQAYQRGSAEWVGVFKKKPLESQTAVAKNGPGIVFTSFDKERVYDLGSFSPVPVYNSKDYKVIMAYFKAGQFIPVHSPGIDLLLYIHIGRGEVVAAESRFNVKPGDIVLVPRGEKRGIKAETDMEVLHIVSPPPTDSDHEEVARKLTAGTFA